MSPANAALLAGILLFAMAAFHAALALGAPWGALAWGGDTEGPLPSRLRAGSALLAPVVAAMAIVMLMRVGWVFPGAAPQMVIPVWAIALFLLIQMFGAWRSGSTRERRIMAPLYTIAVAAAAVVAFGANQIG